MNKIAAIAVFGAAALIMLAANKPQTQPAAGKPAPDFSLTTGDGSQVSLKDYRGKWVVLYFYPKDFTSGCTLEAHNFQRDIAKYEPLNAVILGVSVDSSQSHKDFCAKEGLNFKLLADTDAKVSDEYGSVMDYKGQEDRGAKHVHHQSERRDRESLYGVKAEPKHSEEVLERLWRNCRRAANVGGEQIGSEKNQSIAGIIRARRIARSRFRGTEDKFSMRRCSMRSQSHNHKESAELRRRSCDRC